MFDLRTEAEMRLHSEKVAKELAAAKQREDECREEHDDEGAQGAPHLG